jgi:hypothetical protein
MEKIQNSREWEKEDTELRQKLQELRGVAILLKYEDYLQHMVAEFRKMIDDEQVNGSSWGGKLITSIWPEYIAEEIRFKEWQEGGEEGDQPVRTRRVQFLGLSTRLGWTTDKFILVIKCYNDRNIIAHGANLKDLVEAGKWETLHTQISNDIRELKPITETHPLFRKYAGVIFKGIQTFQSKYFVISAHDGPRADDFELKPHIAEIVAQDREAKNLRREEQEQKENEREKAEEEEKELTEQAIKAITVEFKEGQLNDATSKSWKEILDNKAAIKVQKSTLEKKVKEMTEDLKKMRRERDEMNGSYKP